MFMQNLTQHTLLKSLNSLAPTLSSLLQQVKFFERVLLANTHVCILPFKNNLQVAKGYSLIPELWDLANFEASCAIMPFLLLQKP